MINFSQMIWKRKPLEEPALPAYTPAPENGADVIADLSSVPVASIQLAEETRLPTLSDSGGPVADRFRYLRMHLRELKSAANVRSLMITSPLPKDGKSTVVTNLATILAERGKRKVLVIDADLHHPTVAAGLGIPPRSGLAECLALSLDPVANLQKVEPLHWYLLQAGMTKDNPAELLQTEGLSRLIQRLSPLFAWILIDTPPVNPLTDALTISRQVDGTLLVVRANRTPRGEIDEALTRLGKKHVAGIILNAAEDVNRLYKKYYGYYGKARPTEANPSSATMAPPFRADL
jgi:capsular exopolysaccharide synthesis family protein